MSRATLAPSVLLALAGLVAFAPSALAGPRGGHHYHGGGGGYGYRGGGGYCAPRSGVSVSVGYSSGGWGGGSYYRASYRSSACYDPCYRSSVSSWVIAEPAYVKPYWAASSRYCPTPVYTSTVPVVVTPQPVIISQPAPIIVQSQPTTVYTTASTTPTQVTASQYAAQPASYATTTASPSPILVSSQPMGMPTGEVIATAPAPTAAPISQVVNPVRPAAITPAPSDTIPNDLAMSAYRAGDTVVIAITGTNPSLGYNTTLALRDARETSPTLTLRNSAPTARTVSVPSPFTVNAAVKAEKSVSIISLWVGDQFYQVPITEVTPMS